MKKVNLIIIATIVATFFIAMFAFQPTKTEASNGALPSATPRKIKAAKSITLKNTTISAIKGKKPTNGYDPVGYVWDKRRKQPRKGHQHKPLVKQSQEKEPATMEIPNLIKANPRRRHRH